MELLNKYKIRLDDPNMNMGLCTFFEYTIYNCVSIEYRLKYLQNTANIFKRTGRSHYQLQNFHRIKADIFLLFVYVIYGSCGLLFILFFVTKSPAYVSIMPFLAAFCLNRAVFDKSTRSNLLHIDKFLVNPNWLIKLLQIPSTDTDKFKCLAKQFYWNDLNMQIQENPERIIETQKFSAESEEKIKNDSFKHQCETINCGPIIDFDNVKTLRDICSNETLSNKAIQILSEYFTDDGLVIKRKVSKSYLSAILFVLAEKKYLSKTTLTNQDVQIIVSKLLDENVSIETVKYRAELEQKLKKVRRLFS